LKDDKEISSPFKHMHGSFGIEKLEEIGRNVQSFQVGSKCQF